MCKATSMMQRALERQVLNINFFFLFLVRKEEKETNRYCALLSRFLLQNGAQDGDDGPVQDSKYCT